MKLYSEPFSPGGSVSSEGVRNTLGRPRLDLLTVLVRETLQNSWDARAEADGGISFDVRGWTASGAALEVLRRRVFAELPLEGLRLREILQNDSVSLLAISDRGTTGLGGPTRADEVTDEVHDFVDFLRNVGQPRDKACGGGTFGYGKSILYMASTTRTILVYTRYSSGGAPTSRLMGAALGNQFASTVAGRKRPFTGRHWWGALGPDGIADPLTGAQADALATELGLPGFEGEELGTTIVVIEPKFGDESPQEALGHMAAAVAWNFWPTIMVNDSGVSRVQVRVSWEGEDVPVPDPRSHAPLDAFAKALDSIDSMLRTSEGLPGWDVQEIRCERPRKRLGYLAMARFAARPRRVRSGVEASGMMFTGPAHHIALMRQPRQVVQYLEGPASTDGAVEWAGVFLADRDVDDAFARAEPPTHDDWVPGILDDANEKTFVRVALRQIKKKVGEFAAPRPDVAVSGEAVPLGTISTQLAGLISATESSGAGPSRRKSRRTGQKKASRAPRSRRPAADVTILSRRPMVTEDGKPGISLELELTPAPSTAGTQLSARAEVLTQDGTVEADAPVGARVPYVISWCGPNGPMAEDCWAVESRSEQPERWTLTIGIPDDAAIDIRVAARALES